MLLRDLLIEIRVKKLLTQSALSRELNISQPAISAYESGQRQPDLIALSKIITYANKKCKMQLKIADFRKPVKSKSQ